MPIHGFPGGVISSTAVTPSSTSASGVWTLDEQLAAQGAGNWPAAPLPPLLVTKSLRFRSSASAYLNRTFSADVATYTLSVWVKRGKLGATQQIAGSRLAGVASNIFSFNSSDNLYFEAFNSTIFTSTAVYRDPSAWYHVVLSVTQSGTAYGYVNGVQVASGSVGSSSALFKTGYTNVIGRAGDLNADYFDGYLAEFNFIAGQALTPSYFGNYNADTGIWQATSYSGTYGASGFYLPFTDATSTTTLGNDSSGNGNNWTTNNISVTAGSTYDSMTDVPSLTSATASNFCVINPLSKGTSISVSSANLNTSMASVAWNSAFGTLGVSSGKWYWESTLLTSSGADAGVGISTNPSGSANSYLGVDANSWAYYGNSGNKLNNSSSVSYGATYTNGDVIGIALDLDAGTLTFYKNNTSQGTAYSSLPANTYFPAVTNNNSSFATNFGQRPFAYTPPTGYVALNTFNLPTPTIGATASSQANKYFDVNLYTGNGGGSNTQTISGFQFAPDFVWLKARSDAIQSNLFDTVRGATKGLISSSTSDEITDANSLQSFTSNGYVLGPSTISLAPNYPSVTYVGWNWNAGGTTVTNTSGSISSQVRANTTSGFSVVTYTSTTGTVGHGLGVAPAMIIMKARNLSDQWTVGHKSLGWNYGLALNTTSAQDANSGFWNNTAPTSTVFSQGSWDSGYTKVAYCFSEVAGYSKFGSYTGNGSTDGPFVFTGFRPKFVMIKRTDSGNNWFILDTARDTFNLANDQLLPNSSAAESTGSDCNIDMVSNGFKLRTALDASNGSGGTYIYAAFAESPFKYANAR